MVLVTDIVAPFILLTTAVSWDFLPSAALAPLMVSNVVFLLTQGYFDISAVEKPLLHTWTLSVEEQFYLWAPILLILVFRLSGRRFGTLAAAIGLMMAAASLADTIAQHVSNGQNAAFYLPQYRAWEFLSGGFIGDRAASALRRLPRVLVDLVGWAGIGCILLAVLAFDSGIPYPSSNAALPVAGAALAILSGLSEPGTTLARFCQCVGWWQSGWSPTAGTCGTGRSSHSCEWHAWMKVPCCSTALAEACSG